MSSILTLGAFEIRLGYNMSNAAMHYLKRRPNKKVRKSILARDNYTCRYCGNKINKGEITIDHIHPHSRGGLTVYHNLVAACKICNSLKNDKTPEEAGLVLLPVERYR